MAVYARAAHTILQGGCEVGRLKDWATQKPLEADYAAFTKPVSRTSPLCAASTGLVLLCIVCCECYGECSVVFFRALEFRLGRKLENLFSWSKSRHEKFVGCERAYFYHYYLSWGGWEKEAPPRAAHLYKLKKLTNRYAWAGNAVHEAIRESLLKWLSAQPVDAEALMERTRNRMRQEFVASRDGLCRGQPAQSPFWGLVEHENKVEVSAEEWRSNWSTVETALSHFMASAWPRTFQELEVGRILETDSKDFERSFFVLDGIRVFAMPDVAFVEEGGGVRIVDWKTGSPHEGNVEQVVGYALFVEARHGFPALGSRVSLVYLNQQVEETWVVDEAAIQKFRAFFKASTAAMQAKLSDAASNTALDENHFLKTDMSGRCVLCPFFKICNLDLSFG